MSDFLNIATVALVVLAQSSLQLTLGGLILLYHASAGKHRRRKTRYLAKSYIWGAMAVNFLAVCSSCFVADRLFSGKLSALWMLATIGVLVACGIVMWTIYYRGGKNTETWMPRSFARYIRKKSRNADDNISAFSLGMLSSFVEMPLSLALYLIAGNAILQTSANIQIILIVAYTLLTALPMFVLKLRMKTGANAIAAQRWRVRNKKFIRFVSGSSFLILGLFIFTFWVL